MSWFVDASVMVALAARESDWTHLVDRLDEENEQLWSPVSRWESIVGARRRLESSVDHATRVVDQIAEPFRLVAIGSAEADAALDAHRRYGKGSGHTAKLNMGDCFAYACARTNGARLLYKGDDFVHTDLA